MAILKSFFQVTDKALRLGYNWVHEIESALDRAKVMFVFVTQNSINSDWILFETGHAYAKKICVAPICVDVEINELSAPLNLLQGSKFESCQSLNNIIRIINSEFEKSYSEDFTSEEYDKIMETFTGSINTITKFVYEFQILPSSFFIGFKIFTEFCFSDVKIESEIVLAIVPNSDYKICTDDLVASAILGQNKEIITQTQKGHYAYKNLKFYFNRRGCKHIWEIHLDNETKYEECTELIKLFYEINLIQKIN